MSASDVPVLKAPGDFTAQICPEFDEACARLLASPPSGVVLDLEPVRVLTSAGMANLVRLGQDLDGRGVPLLLAGGRRRIVKLIQTVGLDTVMPHFGTVGEARAYLQDGTG